MLLLHRTQTVGKKDLGLLKTEAQHREMLANRLTIHRKNLFAVSVLDVAA